MKEKIVCGRSHEKYYYYELFLYKLSILFWIQYACFFDSETAKYSCFSSEVLVSLVTFEMNIYFFNDMGKYPQALC